MRAVERRLDVGRVEVFDHTADLGLRIEADDLSDLFRTAAEGLFDVITADRSTIRPRDEEPVELSADSTEQLLVDWLNELIFRVETRYAVYARFDVQVAADGRSARVRVDKVTRGHIHQFTLAGVRNQAGEPLLHDSAYYTLNEVPAP